MSPSLFSCVVVFATVVASQAARLPSSLYPKQNKIPGEVDANGKTYPPFLSEWINMSIRNDPVIKVPIGGILELECEAVGSPPPRIQWYHRKTVLLETGFAKQNEIINTGIGKVKSRVVIDCVMPHHTGVYKCTGSSGSKNKTLSPVTVIVEENSDMANLSCNRDKLSVPRIISWGPTLMEYSDRDVMLPCSAVGNPAPHIYWINNKNQSLDSDTVSPHYKVLKNGDLSITRLRWEDVGTYTCVSRNSLGQDKIESFLYPLVST